jgi:hypothetical protein
MNDKELRRQMLGIAFPLGRSNFFSVISSVQLDRGVGMGKCF